MSGNTSNKFWDNPYWAPLADPLKNVYGIARAPVNDFIEEVSDGWNDIYSRGGTRLGRILSNLGGSIHGGTLAMSIGGMVCGGLAGLAFGGAAGYAGMVGASAAAQWGVTAIAAVGAAGIGVAAGPFVIAAAVITAAAVAGSVVGVVPGIVGGTMKAVKHHIKMKNAPQVAAAAASVAATAPATKKTNKKVSQIVEDFLTLSKSSQEALFAELEKINGDPARYPAEKISAAIQKMPDAERVALIEQLQEKLSGDFGAVAAKQALKAQEEEMEVYSKPIAFKNRAKPAATS